LAHPRTFFASGKKSARSGFAGLRFAPVRWTSAPPIPCAPTAPARRFAAAYPLKNSPRKTQKFTKKEKKPPFVNFRASLILRQRRKISREFSSLRAEKVCNKTQKGLSYEL
jgi:hypothetical protein